MNAGRGRNFGLAISDHLVSVEVFDGTTVRTLIKDECAFGYRQSVFETARDLGGLSAQFKLPKQDSEIGRHKIRERMQLIRGEQDWRYPSAGSVFRANFGCQQEFLGYRIGNAQFSNITANWISNLGG